jgi:peptidoglycan/xylan/chitin deacetylase (PgdA/CDA1 family)
MNGPVKVKTCLARCLQSFGFVERIVLKKSKSSYLILMYHRVIPYNEVRQGIQAGMYVEPTTFEMHILYLKKYFNITSLHEIVLIEKPEIFINNDKPICVLTFDDGWYDFYKYAFPILKEHNVPATVFLPTGFINTKKTFWTDQLIDIIINNNDINNNKSNMALSSVLNNIIRRKGSIEKKIENAILQLKTYREDEIYEIITETKKNLVDTSDANDRAFLNWDEVGEMAKSGLIKFGSHSENHKILKNLNENEIFEELCKSRDRLLSESFTDPSFIPFCYPNGDYNERIVKIVKEVGYHVAVTTENGWNGRGESLYNLQRVAIHQDISSRSFVWL